MITEEIKVLLIEISKNPPQSNLTSMWPLRKFLPFSVRNYSSRSSTIFALSSGQGKCGVAVIRASGPNAGDAILKMTKCKELPKPRTASLQHIKNPNTKEILDKGLVLWFPGPRSFTGEDSCEFQVHGGAAVIASVLTALSALPNFSPAEPGEFTKRAFHAGKLDLTEVEGLGDLIHAETEIQRKQAFLQMEGNLSRVYNSWREVLIKNVAHIEAYIDFSEDDNIEDNVLNVANESLKKLAKEIEIHLADGRKGERLREGVKATIIGEPNSGKSSLLNILCRRPAAIVTPIPGTTRDIIELHLNIDGYPLILIDTAGLRTETTDVVEKEGISRAHAAVKIADLIILVIDSSRYVESLNAMKFQQFLSEHISKLNLENKLENVRLISNEDKHDADIGTKCLYIFNKIDLLSNKEKGDLLSLIEKTENVKCLSCISEEGIQSLINGMSKELEILCGCPTKENPSLTQTRHRHHLTECAKCLKRYLELGTNEDLSIAAHYLRKSLRHLGKITGQVSSEEILDVIFKDFCIGK